MEAGGMAMKVTDLLLGSYGRSQACAEGGHRHAQGDRLL
eukprot:CAMPEP_0174373704 /NCGR_PEP_ID=MMETSP0811_2-20130205/108196_1 /TAXON_ID=73025 ORGANISM="Eutreptiella gymnastica-like, Strain CCMP1594" /NCGR_SAMPLE_ID=MMETSP0811_2 /ASSEMBLY_ACC=CAM_ASM_000667 /LENGTH=38 /DNA_ID= /DNA_START= /DNA_END= /DNA_ORIENTATION=